jgi:putative transposase
MGRKGNCWDNERGGGEFFHTLKTELLYQISYETRREAKDAHI